MKIVPPNRKVFIIAGTAFLALLLALQALKSSIKPAPSPSPSLDRPTPPAEAASGGPAPSSTRPVSVAGESYVLFLGFNEVADQKGLSLKINQPTKQYQGNNAYFARHGYQCRTDTGCDGCADLGRFPLETANKFCESAISQKTNPLSVCGWDAKKAFFGQVVKIEDEWRMYAGGPSFFESLDGLNWTFPKPWLRQFPINVKRDPDNNFRDIGGQSLPNVSNLFPGWACFWPNLYDVRRNRIWLKDQSWHKERPGETASDGLMEWSDPSVMYDPQETDPSKKFKMLIYVAPDYEGFKTTNNEYFGLRLAYSPDGRVWREAKAEEVATCANCPPGLLFAGRRKDIFFQDPWGQIFEVPRCYLDPSPNPQALGEYPWRCLVQTGYRKTVKGVRTVVRGVALLYAPRAEGPWRMKSPIITIDSDHNQFHGAVTRPNFGPQTHLATPWKYQDYTFALYGYIDYSGQAKVSDIRLAVSLDGVNYQGINGEPFGQRSFIPHGPKRYDQGNLWGAFPAVIEPDKIYFYYSGSPCFFPDCADYDYDQGGGLAVLRLDGFTHYQNNRLCQEGDCYLETEPIAVGNLDSWLMANLWVNFKAGAGSSLKAELIDTSTGEPISNFSRQDADALNGNLIKAPVTWQGQGNLKPLALRGVREFKIRFYFTGSTGALNLYSYHFGVGNGPQLSFTAQLPDLVASHQKQHLNALLKITEGATLVGQQRLALAKSGAQAFTGKTGAGALLEAGKTYTAWLKVEGYLSEEIGEFTYQGEDPIPPFTQPVVVDRFGDLTSLPVNPGPDDPEENEEVNRADLDKILHLFEEAQTLVITPNPNQAFFDANGDGRLDVLDVSLLLKNLK